MSLADEWCVAVFKCNSKEIRTALPDLYHYVETLNGVKSIHFLVKDRVDDKAVFSVRIMVDPKQKHIVKSKVAYKLGTLFSSGNSAIEPSSDNPLSQYSAWDPEKRVAECGLKKFDDFTDFLHSMSKLTIGLIEKDYFGSNERVELTRAMAAMLGCTEYGSLSPKSMEIGYYDRIADKYLQHMKEDFQLTA